MSKLYTIMYANYALLIKTLIVNHLGLCKHFSYTDISDSNWKKQPTHSQANISLYRI